MKNILKNYLFPIIILIFVLIGCLIGIYLPSLVPYIKPLGDIYLNLMFTIVVPLVFFTISSSIANMKNLTKLSKIMKRMILVFFVTSLISSIVMIIGVKIYNPAINSNIKIVSEISNLKTNFGTKIVEALTVNDFKDLLSRNHMLPLIIFTILFGIGVSLLKEKNKILSNILQMSSEAMMKIVKILMYYAPIGLCGYFASNISTFGASLLEGYLKAFILYTIVGIVYYLVFYTLYAHYAYRKKGIKKFYKNALLPTLTALATQSSLASLPSNLEATKNIGVPKEVRDMSVTIGSTINMHGSVMSAILKIAFLFTIFGLKFSGFSTILLAIIVSLLSGMVMSGIPGGGLIGEMIIVSLYNFPTTAFPIIATIGIVIDAPATVLNVIGNTTTSMIIGKHVKSD